MNYQVFERNKINDIMSHLQIAIERLITDEG